MASASRLDEVGERDGWRCWLCDEPVDADRSVNDDRGPSVDGRTTAKKAKKSKKKGSAERVDRLAHRACNTGKGNVDAVVAWPDHLFVADPAVIIPTVDRMMLKGGKEIFGRCPSEADATDVAEWLVDRISRLEPGLELSSRVQEGGGQFLVVLESS